MTKEELKEAIAATITENGQKGITGQALANLLNEIVDAAGEGGGGGSSLLYLYATDVVGPNEHNAQIYNTIEEGIRNGVGYQLALIEYDGSDGVAYTSTTYVSLGGIVYITFVMYLTGQQMWISAALYSNGMLTMEQ